MKPRAVILLVFCLTAGWYNAARFSSAVMVGLRQGVPDDMYPLWNGSRAALTGVDPYGSEVTQQNDFGVYGTTAKAVGDKKGQQFAYLIYAALAVMPLKLVSFHVANQVAFWLFVAIVLLSVDWLRERWDWTTVLVGTLCLSTYPVIFGIQSRQPRILFFGLAIGSFPLLRSGRLIPAAIVAGLSTGKPRIALPVLLPMLLWTIVRWNERKRFAISLTTSLVGLIAVAIGSAMISGWIAGWISALRHYASTHEGRSSFCISAATSVLRFPLCSFWDWQRLSGNIASPICCFRSLSPCRSSRQLLLMSPITSSCC